MNFSVNILSNVWLYIKSTFDTSFVLQSFFAFACNAKRFAIVFLFFLLFVLHVSALGWAGKIYFQLFVQLLLWALATRIGNDMPRAFNSCLLEKNSNGGLKRDHLEFSFSANKNISPLPQYLWPPNLAVWWLTIQVFLPIKSYDPLIMWSWKITSQTKFIIALLPECLRPPNLAGWYLTLMGCYP